jgi:hypothetical protein
MALINTGRAKDNFSSSVPYVLTAYANAIDRDVRLKYKTCAVRVIGFGAFGGVFTCARLGRVDGAYDVPTFSQSAVLQMVLAYLVVIRRIT